MPAAAARAYCCAPPRGSRTEIRALAAAILKINERIAFVLPEKARIAGQSLVVAADVIGGE
jgi:hypothetical protein